METKMHDIGFT